MTVFHRVLCALGIISLGSCATVAVLAPWLAPFAPDATLVPFALPGTATAEGQVFWLGTDHLGRDMLSRFLFGLRSSLAWIFLAVLCTYIFALPLAWLASSPNAMLARSASGVVAIGRASPPVVVYLVLISAFGAWPHLLFAAFAIASLPNLADGCTSYRLVKAKADSNSFRTGQLEAFLAVDALRRAAFFGGIIETFGWFGMLPGYSWVGQNLGEMLRDYAPFVHAMPHVALLGILPIGLALGGLQALATGLEPLVPRVLCGHDPARPSFRSGS